SSTTGGPISKMALGNLITKTTFETIGVAVSPHLFRTAAASTAVTHCGGMPHLASALLNHTDPRVTEHYNRATSITASRIYAEITAGFLRELTAPPDCGLRPEFGFGTLRQDARTATPAAPRPTRRTRH